MAQDVSVGDDCVFPMPAAPSVPQRNKHYQGLLYRCPSRIGFATYVPVALSLAKRALTCLKQLAQDKTPYATDKKLAHRPIAQIHYGKALALYRSVNLLFYDALDVTWQRACDDVQPSQEERADLYLTGVHTVQTAAQAVAHVAAAAGSSVLDKTHPLERILRDMETLKHHGFVNESRYGSVAQVHWGADLDYPLLLR